MMKNLARDLLPGPMWAAMKQKRADMAAKALLASWQQAVKNIDSPARGHISKRRLLIGPSDPRFIVGSCGDEAMIKAITYMAENYLPGADIDILVAGPEAAKIGRDLGFNPRDIWAEKDFVKQFEDLMRTYHYSDMAFMGADIIDGYYGSAVPSRMLIAMDLAARYGVHVTMLGASFSLSPEPRLKPFFDNAHPSIRFGLRDSISLQRFQNFTTASGQLVADSAFMLPPLEPEPEILTWINQQKAVGKTVLGFNVHPMLLRNDLDDPVKILVEPSAAALKNLHASRPVAIVLIPHDRREDCGDFSVLKGVHALLQQELGNDIRIYDGYHPAAQLKGLAGQMDGVVTGRMHLAIGSLGMGTPILGISYQDKFEGLLAHFSLPAKNLLTLDDLSNADVFAQNLRIFVDSLKGLRNTVEEKLTMVKDLSKLNFESFREFEAQ